MADPAARSLIFSTPMIRALAAGRKTVTRRVLTYPATSLRRHGHHWAEWLRTETEVDSWHLGELGWAPYGDAGMQNGCRETKGPLVPERLAPGTPIWVRESFSAPIFAGIPRECAYRADRDAPTDHGLPWTSARFMPRKHSRFLLEVVSLRVERLHEITDEDLFAEGLDMNEAGTFYVDDGPDCFAEFAEPREAFAFAWDGINGRRAPFEANPWVRRIEFRRIEGGP